MRLQKFLSSAGVESRRRSEKLILEGRVSVNGETVAELGVKVDPAVDRVQVDGHDVSLTEQEKFVYLVLNKPGGYVSTMDDPQHRPCVASLVPDDFGRIYHVGRLDRDTTGLLLFTNDGELHRALLAPASHVDKRYRVEVDGRLAEVEVQPLREGLMLDGRRCAPAMVTIDEAGPTSRVTCIIHEGRKRQVKRMFAAIGHPVLRLMRDRFGPIELGDLPEGEWRLLDDDEVEALRASACRAGHDRGDEWES